MAGKKLPGSIVRHRALAGFGRTALADAEADHDQTHVDSSPAGRYRADLADR